MAEVKDNEQKPDLQDKEKKPNILTLDDVEYDINNMTDYQKDIINDINNYQVQQSRLERWKQGQIYILQVSLNGQSKEDVSDEAIKEDIHRKDE